MRSDSGHAIVSNRSFTTTASSSRSARIASRRKAAFLALDSTIVSLADGCTILNGMAGEPPPEPTSNHVTGEVDRESGRGERLDEQAIERFVGRRISGRAVRLIFSFHCCRSRK